MHACKQTVAEGDAHLLQGSLELIGGLAVWQSSLHLGFHFCLHLFEAASRVEQDHPSHLVWAGHTSLQAVVAAQRIPHQNYWLSTNHLKK